MRCFSLCVQSTRMSNLCAVVGSSPGRKKLFSCAVRIRIASARVHIALGHVGKKLQRRRIRIGNHVVRKGLPRSVGIVGNERIVDGKAVGRKVAGALRAGGHRKVVRSIELLLLRRLVIAKDEELVVQDGSADGPAFLVAVKGRRRVGCAVAQLALLVEVLVRGQHVGPEDAEGIAVELVRPGLRDQADDALRRRSGRKPACSAFPRGFLRRRLRECRAPE